MFIEMYQNKVWDAYPKLKKMQVVLKHDSPETFSFAQYSVFREEIH